MSAESWKLENDLCRCCHAEGSFKSLGEPYYSLGQTEIFTEMLRHCFDIEMNQVEGAYSTTTFTICEICIVRLRDASNFKHQVLMCEERFKDMYRNVKDIIEIQVKQESPSPSEDGLKAEDAAMSDDGAFDLRFDDDDDEDDEKTVLEIKIEDAKKSKGKGKAKPKPTSKAKKAVTKKVSHPKPKASKSKSAEAKAEDESKPKKGGYAVLEQQGAKKYICHTCGAKFNGKKSIRQHITRQHTIQSCPLCDQKFPTLFQKKRHFRSEHEKKSNTVLKEEFCVPESICGASTYCDVCNKDYKTNDKLRRHWKWFHRTTQCPECSVSVLARDLARHQHEEHGTSIPTCGVCDYKNPKKSLVIDHQRKVHLKEKNVSCPQCDLKFFDKANLKRHLVRHGAIKKFECSFCHKKFPRRCTMQMHEKIHKGEKNKVCTICDAKFVQKASLNYHMGKHHPDAC